MLRRGMLRPSASLNVVFDGNSLVSGGTGEAVNMPTRAAASAPLAGSGCSVQNVGVSGQTWRMMNGLDGGSAADVDGAWVNGKYNVLVCWESTNAITAAGRTAQQAFDDCIAYVAARKAAHPWRVVMMTAIPRSSALDVNLREWNALARDSYRSMGVDVLVEARRGPLNFNGEVSANFTATQPYWIETSGWTHLSDFGYQLVAEWVAAGIRRLPFLAPT